MGIVHNTRLMIKICELYYLANMSQKEISTRLGISRPQVSRILAQARDSGVVTVKISNPYSRESELEKQLIEVYGLKDALVVDTGGADSESRLDHFVREAVGYLDDYIPAGGRVGVMGGITVSRLVDAMKPSGKKVAEVVPLVGSVGAGNVEIHANNIAQRLARVHGGTAYSMNAPVVVSDPSAAEFLRGEPTIEKVLTLGMKCDVALVGVGSVEMNATNVRAGGLTAADIEYLKREGAAASVCTSYINAEGEPVGERLQERSIGQSLDTVKKAKLIGAAVGESKAPAIRAALKTGRIDVFLTNILTAQRILEGLPAENAPCAQQL